MKTIKEFKRMAEEKFQVSGPLATEYKNSIDFLYSLDWPIPNGPAYGEDEVTSMNLDLDQRGCFGRSVRAAVLAEQFFTSEKLFLGEVCEDFFRNMLVKGATELNWRDETYIEEILQYENPHTIILSGGGQQFDPMFKLLAPYPQAISHPSVNRLPLWEGLYCSYLVSESLLAQEKSLRESFEIILIALTICSEMILLKENLISIYGSFYDFDKAIELAKIVSLKRKDARMLYVLWSLTDDDSYKDQIISEYDVSMFNHLNSQL